MKLFLAYLMIANVGSAIGSDSNTKVNDSYREFEKSKNHYGDRNNIDPHRGTWFSGDKDKFDIGRGFRYRDKDKSEGEACIWNKDCESDNCDWATRKCQSFSPVSSPAASPLSPRYPAASPLSPRYPAATRVAGRRHRYPPASPLSPRYAAAARVAGHDKFKVVQNKMKDVRDKFKDEERFHSPAASPASHRYLDASPASHRYLDASPASHRYLDASPASHRYLDASPASHRYLDASQDMAGFDRKDFRFKLAQN